MATKTTNYNLIKPALTDDADIRVINGNMDVLDNQLKSISDKAGTATNNAYTNLTVSSDYTWKFTKGSGANTSYDTIKKATTATALSGTASTYKVPKDASKYSQLEYWFGTQPYKGSSSNTIDGSMLKFNHWGESSWNTALICSNNASNRPYMAYQNGTAGEYSIFKDLAWYEDATNKLPLAGGTMTGAIKTTDNIYKQTNNGVLVLSGSTDASHGGRINLSGEKETNAGAVKITADNGTASNVFEVTAGSRYNFNGLTTYMNSNDDYFRLGGNDAYLRLGKNKQLYCNTERINLSKTSLMTTDTDLFKVGEGNTPWFAINKQENKIYYSPQGTNKGYEIPYATTPLSFIGTQKRGEAHTGHIKLNNGLLIQWGCSTYSGVGTWNKPIVLPLPYANTGYVAMSTFTFPNFTHTVGGDNRDVIYVQSETTIGVWADEGAITFWMTIGQGA